MEPKRTVLETYSGEDTDYIFSVEKWWIPTAAVTDGKMESYVGIGLVHTELGGEHDTDVALLSLDRAEALANKILEVIKKSR